MRILTIVLACFCIYAAPLFAEIYSWTDSSGTVNFTEDYSSVPPKYRKKVNRREDTGGQPAQAEHAPDVALTDSKGIGEAKTGAVAAEKDAKTSSPDASYGGRKFEEWKRDFEVQGSELKTLEAKVKEIEAVRNQMNNSSGRYSRDQLQRMYESHNAAVESYNKAIERYNLLVESAKKAGVPINSGK